MNSQTPQQALYAALVSGLYAVDQPAAEFIGALCVPVPAKPAAVGWPVSGVLAEPVVMYQPVGA